MKKAIQAKHIPDQEIIDACNAFHNLASKFAATPEQSLAHKYPPKVILAKMAAMARKGILNYGVSLRTAWVEKR